MCFVCMPTWNSHNPLALWMHASAKTFRQACLWKNVFMFSLGFFFNSSRWYALMSEWGRLGIHYVQMYKITSNKQFCTLFGKCMPEQKLFCKFMHTAYCLVRIAAIKFRRGAESGQTLHAMHISPQQRLLLGKANATAPSLDSIQGRKGYSVMSTDKNVLPFVEWHFTG